MRTAALAPPRTPGRVDAVVWTRRLVAAGAVLAAVAVLAACTAKATFNVPKVPELLQFRSVTGALPAQAATVPAASGVPATTADAVWTKVGARATQVAQSAQEPVTDPETLRAFGALQPSEVALLPPSVQFYVTSISCAVLLARPGAYPDPDADAVMCDNPADPSAMNKYLLGAAEITGADVSSARLDKTAPTVGVYMIDLEFTDDGAKLWEGMTTANVGRQVAVSVGNQVATAPLVQTVITGGATQLSGNFTEDEARRLAELIASAAAG